MASIYNRRYVLVNDPSVSEAFMYTRAKTTSENIITGFVQYGNIEDKSLSIIKDKNTYSGEMGAFRKFNDFAYQNEYRIAINFNSLEPQKIYIGSLIAVGLRGT